MITKWIVLLAAVTLLVAGAAGAQEGWPEQYYAPYVYGAAGFPLAYLAETAGVRYLTLSFILAGPDGCQAAWDGSIPLDLKKQVAGEIEKLREAGGDVIISFGGAAGDELALACPDAETLAAQYQAVVDAYGVTRLDFDIEANEIRDSETVERRSQAIALLQQRGESIEVIFTLPALPTGLTDDGLALLQSAIDSGVDIDVVNIMTMNFGDAYPPDEMGALTIQAAESLFEQLGTLYPDKSEAERWGMIGLTPMIGMNDTQPAEFTLDDAALVVDFARERGIRHLAMWSLNRDKACGGDAKIVSASCSGVSQADNAYSAVFGAFGASE